MSYPCLILAAGFGTRMGSLVEMGPKSLIEVAGRPLVEHALTVARDVGARPIAVNGHFRAEVLKNWLRRNAPDVIFLHEQPEILDSGGAVKNALSVFGPGPIFTLNADAVFRGGSPLRGLAQAWDPERMEGLLSVVPRGSAVGRKGGGDFALDVNGRLDWDNDPDAHVYTGAQILRSERFVSHAADVFPLRTVWDGMRSEGTLFGAQYDGQWADVGHPEGIAAAERMVGYDRAL